MIQTAVNWQPLVLPGRREHISLVDKFNSDKMISKNCWHLAPVDMDISERVITEGGKSFLHTGEYKFEVFSSGNNMVLLTVGELERYSLGLQLSDKPYALSLDIGKCVNGFEFLAASEWEIRQCGAQIGCINLHYGDGFCQTEPIIHGRNTGSIYYPLAAEAVHVELFKYVPIMMWPPRYIDAFAVEADSTRKLDFLEIRLYAADGVIGIFAVNAILPEQVFRCNK